MLSAHFSPCLPRSLCSLGSARLATLTAPATCHAGRARCILCARCAASGPAGRCAGAAVAGRSNAIRTGAGGAAGGGRTDRLFCPLWAVRERGGCSRTELAGAVRLSGIGQSRGLSGGERELDRSAAGETGWAGPAGYAGWTGWIDSTQHGVPRPARAGPRWLHRPGSTARDGANWHPPPLTAAAAGTSDERGAVARCGRRRWTGHGRWNPAETD